jgi:hypothetical protein
MERFEMLIVSIDSSDAVLMKMQLTSDALRKWVDEPVKRGRDSREEARQAEVNLCHVTQIGETRAA